MGTPRRLAVALIVVAVGAAAVARLASAISTTPIPLPGGLVLPSSVSVVCALSGYPETYTATKYGIDAGDRGYSFEFGGETWWLFGDSRPSKTFSSTNASSRYPGNPSLLDNDSIAHSPIGSPGECPTLTYVTRSDGSYANPSVAPDPLFRGVNIPISLRANESPLAGLEVSGKMYVVFATDNATDLGPIPPTSKFGNPTRTVMAVLNDTSTADFTGLYDLSAPSTRYANGAKFVNVAMQFGRDGEIYFWGTPGAPGRAGSAYLARIAPANIATGAGIQYYGGMGKAIPRWVSSEADAKILFHQKQPCMRQLGVEYDPYLERWLMLYNCTDDTPGHPNGIYLRSAPQPWGPWSAPRTIFDPDPDELHHTGFCYFIYSVSKKGPLACPAGAPNPPGKGHMGSYYGPYFVNGWTNGTYGTATKRSTSTIYYTLDTFNPYGQLILGSAIKGPFNTHPPPPPVTLPGCTGGQVCG